LPSGCWPATVEVTTARQKAQPCPDQTNLLRKHPPPHTSPVTPSGRPPSLDLDPLSSTVPSAWSSSPLSPWAGSPTPTDTGARILPVNLFAEPGGVGGRRRTRSRLVRCTTGAHRRGRPFRNRDGRRMTATVLRIVAGSANSGLAGAGTVPNPSRNTHRRASVALRSLIRLCSASVDGCSVP
jgi:hypothetical protein